MDITMTAIVKEPMEQTRIEGDTPTLRLFSLLEVIAGKDEFFSLQSLVEETGLPKPTLHRMLQQLETAGSFNVTATTDTTVLGSGFAILLKSCCSTAPPTVPATRF